MDARAKRPKDDDARTGDSPNAKRASGAAQGGSAPRAGLQPASGGDATRVTIRAQPGASRTGFAGLWNGMPKIAVTAPPENGRANEEIAAELARLFGLRAAQVTQVSGATSRAKVFQLEIPPARVAARLDELVRAAEEAAAKRDERREDKKN